MDDLISRQKVLHLIRNTMSEEATSSALLYQAVSQMDSEEQEHKVGKWIETDDGWDGIYYVCSECGCPWTIIDGTPHDNGMNYCPNCGKKMGIEDE